MPLQKTEIINVLQQLAEQENLKVSIVESGKGALIAGSCAFVGGLMGGPVGLGIGGVIGAVTAAVRGSGKYKSVAHVIMYDMTPAQHNKLAQSVQRVVEDVHVQDLAIILTMIMTESSMKKLILMELAKFLKNEMGLAIM